MQLRSTLSDIKYSLRVFKGRCVYEQAEKKTRELKTKTVEIIQFGGGGAQKEK